jgi:phage I-like protein
MSESTATLNRVILSLPSLVSLAMTKADTADAPRSWIQLAKTGTFHSTRYGKFSITRDDLSQMLHNFRNVTPAAPTELPIDYDHLSMDPKQPGDGKAAGWLKRVELRAEGEELWGEVEWTPEAADLIQNRAYRFVSPSFVKDHTHKDGRKIGTTLLAAAITNHPFLEGMQALTLYSFSAMGDLALVETPTTAAPVHLAELGQRVTFKPDAERTPELTDEERRQTFIVKTSIGEGDDQFVRLTRLDGTEFGWFRVSTQLAPASAAEPERTRQEDTTMSAKNATTELLNLAHAVMREQRLDFRSALLEASRQRPDLAAIHIATPEDTTGDPTTPAPVPTPDTGQAANELLTLANTIARERGISLRNAMIQASAQLPEAVAAYREAFRG